MAPKNTNSRGKYDESHFVFHSYFQPQSSGLSMGTGFLPFHSLPHPLPAQAMKGCVRHFLGENSCPCARLVSLWAPCCPVPPHLRGAAPCPSRGCGGSSSGWRTRGWREGTSHAGPGRKTPHSSAGNPAARAQQGLQSNLRREALLPVP